MANTPREAENEVLKRAEENILRAYRVAGENAKGRSEYEKNLRTDMLMKERIRIRQLLALTYSDFKGGATKADALGIRDAWGDFIDELYGVESVDFDQANMEEEVAEGSHEVAQTRLMIERSGPAARAFLATRRVYQVADEALARCAHSILSGARA